MTTRTPKHVERPKQRFVLLALYLVGLVVAGVLAVQPPRVPGDSGVITLDGYDTGDGLHPADPVLLIDTSDGLCCDRPERAMLCLGEEVLRHLQHDGGAQGAGR
jgi:hypothetical protein